MRPIDHLAFTHQREKQYGAVHAAHHPTLVTVYLIAEEERTRKHFMQTGMVSDASRDSHIGGRFDGMYTLAVAMVNHIQPPMHAL